MGKVLHIALRILVILLVFVFITDPADSIFHLKMPLFIFIVFTWGIAKIIANKVSFQKRDILFFVLYLSIPLFGILSALLQRNMDNIEFASGFLKSAMLLSLIIIFNDTSIRLDKIVVYVSFILPLLTLFCYRMILVNPDYFNTIILPYLVEDKGTAALAIRYYYGFQLFMLFFKTSPLLVFTLGYFCHQVFNGRFKGWSFLAIVILLFTLFLSGTRANILAGFLVFVCLTFYNLSLKRNKFPLLAAFISFFFLIGLFVSNASFDERDASQEIKSQHLESYKDVFEANPLYLIVGQGLGSEFYSKGFEAKAPHTELTYIDIIRIFGLPAGLIFLGVIFSPLVYLLFFLKGNSEVAYLIVSYGAYLFIAGTNPLLVSSTGVLAILFILSAINRIEGQYATRMGRRSPFTTSLNTFSLGK